MVSRYTKVTSCEGNLFVLLFFWVISFKHFFTQLTTAFVLQSSQPGLPCLACPGQHTHFIPERGNCPRHHEFGEAGTQMTQRRDISNRLNPAGPFWAHAPQTWARQFLFHAASWESHTRWLHSVHPALRTYQVLRLEIKTPAPSADLLTFDVFSNLISLALPNWENYFHHCPRGH